MIANHGTHRISTFTRVPSKQPIGLSQPPSLMATKQKLVFSSRRSSANASCSSTSSRDGNKKAKAQPIRKKVPRMSLDGGQLLEVTGLRPQPKLTEYGLLALTEARQPIKNEPKEAKDNLIASIKKASKLLLTVRRESFDSARKCLTERKLSLDRLSTPREKKSLLKVNSSSSRDLSLPKKGPKYLSINFEKPDRVTIVSSRLHPPVAKPPLRTEKRALQQ